jgi:hypothetical protein
MGCAVSGAEFGERAHRDPNPIGLVYDRDQSIGARMGVHRAADPTPASVWRPTDWMSSMIARRKVASTLLPLHFPGISIGRQSVDWIIKRPRRDNIALITS